MTEQIGDQISAFIDDELSEDEGAFLVRRMDCDPGSRGRAFRYMTIGCALRGELLSPDPALLRRRIQNVLAGGAVPPLARPKARLAPRFVKPLLGLGVAASVAVVALGLVRFVNDAGPAATSVASGPMQVREWREPPSYTVPQDPRVLDGDGVAVRAIPTNYLLQHGEYTSGLSRMSMYSSIAGAAEPQAEVVPAKPERSSASVVPQGSED
jgi:sigma-E factor negative regulatory protein RseA